MSCLWAVMLKIHWRPPVEAIVISRSVKQSDTLEMPQEKSRRFRIASQQTSVP
jgi:hypothetical protein